MKPMSLLLCSMAVSIFGAAAAAQNRPQGWAQNGRATTIEAAQQINANEQRREFTPPAPRGDLRGDIASNAHARPEPQARDDNQRRQR